MAECSIRGPRGLPIVGSLPDFWRDRLGFMERCRARYGRTVPLRMPGPAVLINEPADVEHVLVTAEERYEKSWQNTEARARRLHGRALLTSKRRGQRPMRAAVNPAFHRRAIASYARIVLDEAQRATERWPRGTPVDAWARMRRYTQDALVRCLFGPLPGEEAAELAAAVRRRRGLIRKWFDFQWLAPDRWPTAEARRFRRADVEVRERMRAVLARPASSESLVAAMRDLSLEDEAIEAETLELLSAGYETTGDGLTWALVCLARNPEIAGRLAEAVGSGPADAEGLLRETYIEQCFAETLRLYPPTWLFVRVAQQADRMPSGAELRAGTKVFLSPYLVQRDAQFFDEPEAFRPERFDAAVRHARPRFSYYPFGGGVRRCLGEAFARLESTAGLAAIGSRLRLSVEPGQDLRPVGRITLQPRGPVWMRATNR